MFTISGRHVTSLFFSLKQKKSNNDDNNNKNINKCFFSPRELAWEDVHLSRARKSCGTDSMIFLLLENKSFAHTKRRNESFAKEKR